MKKECKNFCLIACLGLLLSIAIGEPISEEDAANFGDTPIVSSWVELAVLSARLNRKVIDIDGFLSVENHGDFLVITMWEDSESMLLKRYKRSLEIAGSTHDEYFAKQIGSAREIMLLDKKYVLLTGRFQKHVKYEHQSSLGAIVEVRSLKSNELQ
jgi:hypothetical protein